MRFQLFLPAFLGLLLGSCVSSDEPKPKNPKRVDTTTIEYGADTPFVEHRAAMPCDSAVATLEVMGMMCEIGCVSTVRKKLYDLADVDDVVIDFQDGREINFAQVRYDPRDLSVRDIVRQVEEIGDGMYPVEFAEITRPFRKDCEE